MSKKMIMISSIFVLVFATALPVYAQDVSPTPAVQQGFFGEIANFFGNFFHAKSRGSIQTQEQGLQNQSVTPGQAAPSGMMNPSVSGQPDYLSMQQRRLTILVQQGKITQAQSDAILAELTRVQSELKAWAQSQGINESYVLSGPLGLGIGQGMQRNGGEQGQGQQGNNGGQSFQQNDGQSQQGYPGRRMMYRQGPPQEGGQQ